METVPSGVLCPWKAECCLVFQITTPRLATVWIPNHPPLLPFLNNMVIFNCSHGYSILQPLSSNLHHITCCNLLVLAPSCLSFLSWNRGVSSPIRNSFHFSWVLWVRTMFGSWLNKDNLIQAWWKFSEAWRIQHTPNSATYSSYTISATIKPPSSQAAAHTTTLALNALRCIIVLNVPVIRK